MLTPENAPRLLQDIDRRKPVTRPQFTPTLQFAPTAPPLSSTSGPMARAVRLAGWFKLWAAVAFFDPHLEYASVDWSEELAAEIPNVEQATTLPDYYNLLQRITARLNDSHVSVAHPSLSNRDADGSYKTWLSESIRWIEGRCVIESTFRYADGSESPLRVGDSIVAVQGRPIAEFVASVKPLVSASTPGARDRMICDQINVAGSPEQVELRVESANGQRDVVVRKVDTSRVFGLPYRVLPGNLGYITFNGFSSQQVNSALQAVRQTDGLIVDRRGFSDAALLPHLLTKPAPSSVFEVPVLFGPDLFARMWKRGRATLYPDAEERYEKPIVVLIDSRVQSSTEHFCIYLKNARRARFVGQQTSGANGNVTTIMLPDGGLVDFTGGRILFADGSQFQNRGIVPDIPATPTIDGLRHGRDEVLEAGIRELKRMLSGVAVPR